MACYDCEDCSRHIYNGGKCTRFEYDCPFLHLVAYNDTEKKCIEEDIETLKIIKCELQKVNKLFDKLNYKDDYDDLQWEINRSIESIGDRTDDDLIAEWKEINQ